MTLQELKAARDAAKVAVEALDAGMILAREAFRAGRIDTDSYFAVRRPYDAAQAVFHEADCAFRDVEFDRQETELAKLESWLEATDPEQADDTVFAEFTRQRNAIAEGADFVDPRADTESGDLFELA